MMDDIRSTNDNDEAVYLENLDKIIKTEFSNVNVRNVSIQKVKDACFKRKKEKRVFNNAGFITAIIAIAIVTSVFATIIKYNYVDNSKVTSGITSTPYITLVNTAGPTVTSALTPTATPASTLIDDNFQTIKTNIEFGVYYDDLKQLVDNSDIIIEGKVTETSYFDYNTVTYTKCRIKVIKSFNDNAKPGDELLVYDLGGITTQANLKNYTGRPWITPTDEDKNTYVKVLSGGSDFMKVNDNVLLFCGLGKLIPGEKYYSPIGGYQGKFIISGSKAERYTPDNSSDKYKSLNKDIATIEKEIENYITPINIKISNDDELQKIKDSRFLEITSSDPSDSTIYKPIDSDVTMAKITNWLKRAEPYNGIIPVDKGLGTYKNPYPPEMQLSDGRNITIRFIPTFAIANNGGEGTVISDILMIKKDNQTSYIKCRELFNWFQNDEWKAEFQ